MNVKQELTISQRQSLSQNQIASLELLALNSVELEKYMEQEYMENPMLEQNEHAVAGTGQEDFKAWYDTNYNSGYIQSGSLRDAETITRREAGSQPEVDSVYTYLFEQLDLNRYSRQQIKVIDFLIQSLDDNGYLDLDISEISQLTGVSRELVVSCVSDLRELEPCGVFASDLYDCLLLQAESVGARDEYLEQIIRNHLHDISAGRISAVTRALNLSTAQVREYIQLISSFNPKPLRGFGEEQDHYIMPDVIVTMDDDGGWRIAVNERWNGSYQLSDYYLHMMAEVKEQELFEYFKSKLERARFLIQAVEQRRETLTRITRAVLDVQDDFFRKRGSLRPCTMASLAETLGISVSTVSRAVRDKYLQYPGGSVAMRRLFSASVSGAGDQQINADEVKAILKGIVDGEDKKKPYSDAKLAEILKSRGINLSRRVIAKYREEMGIRGSFERRS